MGSTHDDKKLIKLDHFLNHEVVITEKMDGENTSLYSNKLHARSTDSRDHPSRHWIKTFHASIKNQIPKDHRICGENLYAKHSIGYDHLKSYFYAFSIWNEDRCLNWSDTFKTCKHLNLELVPVKYIGPFDSKVLKQCIDDLDTKKEEGLVIRSTQSFLLSTFSQHVAKYVRKNHVQTDQHWMHKKIQKNKLTV